MSRKDAAESHHGWRDFIGVALLAAAALLLLAQMSFDWHDISALCNPANKPLHNWIGWLGAHLAWSFFFIFGVTAYIIPILFAAFGLGYLFNFLGYLREHSRWSVMWAGILLLSLTGLLHIMFESGLTGRVHVALGAQSAGGALGWATFEYIFWMAGKIGAVILYGVMALIGILFLTNFKLGEWLQARFDGESLPVAKAGATAAEAALERKARDLEKKKRELEEEVAKSSIVMGKSIPTGPALGQDFKSVPEPNVRDLSVPQAKVRAKKSSAPEPEKEILPPDEGVVIPASELKAASTEDVLGRKSEAPAKTEDKDSDGEDAEKSEEKSDEPKPEPVINITGLTRPKPKPKKPITVASTPMIGNYQLPSMDFLQMPDMTLKPTESKEELLANARLMQQTLAQFDIPVELGDITKGPTITRYELHPAPGVKLEKITALSNNIAAALKAERINILAPVPGKSSVGVEVPNAIKTKVAHWRAILPSTQSA